MSNFLVVETDRDEVGIVGVELTDFVDGAGKVLVLFDKVAFGTGSHDNPGIGDFTGMKVGNVGNEAAVVDITGGVDFSLDRVKETTKIMMVLLYGGKFFPGGKEDGVAEREVFGLGIGLDTFFSGNPSFGREK